MPPPHQTSPSLPLGNLLPLLLPTPTQTLLLQACLLEGAAGRSAWQAWLGAIGEPITAIKQDRDGIKRVLPLLSQKLSKQDWVTDAEVLTVLRTGYVRETLRSATYTTICHDVLGTLQQAAVPVLVLKGAALQQGCYPDTALRHCHDLDLLIQRADLERAERILTMVGKCQPLRQRTSSSDDRALQHPSGLPIIIYSQPFRIQISNGMLADIWRRSECTSAFGRPVSVMTTSDMLLHICGHAALSSSRTTGVWVCDAFHLLTGKSAIDWDRLVESAKQTNLALPLSIMLDYLAATFDLQIDPLERARLRQVAARVSRLEQELVLWGAFQGSNGNIMELWRLAQTGYERRVLLRWLVIPSVAFLRATTSTGRLLATNYFVRPVRYLTRRLIYR